MTQLVYALGHSDNAWGDHIVCLFYDKEEAKNRVQEIIKEKFSYLDDNWEEWRENPEQNEIVLVNKDKDCPECFYIRELKLF